MTSLGSRSHVRVCGDLQGCSRSRNPSRAQFRLMAAKIDSQVVEDAISWCHLHGLVRLSSSHDAQAHMPNNLCTRDLRGLGRLSSRAVYCRLLAKEMELRTCRSFMLRSR